MRNLKQVIMEHDELTSEEADEMIAEAREAILSGEDPEEVLMNDFGLEPDYLEDLF